MRLRNYLAASSLVFSACSSSNDVQHPQETTSTSIEPSFTAEQAAQFVKDRENKLNERLASGEELTLPVAMGWCMVWLENGTKNVALNPILDLPLVSQELDIQYAHIPFTTTHPQSADATHASLSAAPYVFEGFFSDIEISPGMDERKWFQNATGPESTPTGEQGLVQRRYLSVEQVLIDGIWQLQTSDGDPVAYSYPIDQTNAENPDLLLCWQAEEAWAQTPRDN